MVTRESQDRPNSLTAAWVHLAPNPLQLLVVVSLILLFIAVFIFGERGKYRDPDIADILRTVAVGGLAAAVSTLIDRQVYSNELQHRISAGVSKALGVVSSLNELGVTRAYADFDFGLIFREAESGETVSWLDTYCPRQDDFIEDLSDALKRGVQVRMLIIDPTSRNAQYRNEELQQTIDTGPGWIAALEVFIAKMNAIASRGPGQFEIRFYSDLPCAPIYLVGKSPHARKGYFSLFLVQATSNCHHIELHDGEWLSDMACYFEQKWARQAALSKNVAISK